MYYTYSDTYSSCSCVGKLIRIGARSLLVYYIGVLYIDAIYDLMDLLYYREDFVFGCCRRESCKKSRSTGLGCVRGRRRGGANEHIVDE